MGKMDESQPLTGTVEELQELTDTSSAAPPLKIHNAAIQKVDCKGETLGAPYYRTNEPGIREYLAGVLRSVVNIPRSQRFQFNGAHFPTRDVVTDLTTSMFKSVASDFTQRLLDCEIVVQKKIAGLNELRAGSLLAAHFSLAETEYVMLVKIDHAGFLNELDFQKASGLPDKQRAQKCATFTMTNGVVDDVVIISDSNSNLSEYWWNAYLDLKPLSDPEQNTHKAFKAVEKFLKSKIQKSSPSDYWTLRNAFVSYFVTRSNCVFDEMIDEVMTEYVANSDTLNMPKLAAEAKQLPKLKEFDSHFSIAPNIISNKIKRQIHLAPNLDLRITGEISNFSKTFGTGEDGGRKFLKIYSDEGYAAFHKRVDEDDISNDC